MADYAQLKVTELRELLKDRGIPSTGLTRKQQIIDALEAHDAEAGDDTEPAAAEEIEAEEPAEEPAAQESDAPEPEEPVAAQTEEPVKEPEVEAPAPPAPLSIPDEIHQPVSNTASKFATPQRASPAPSQGSTESRKRKRRSPTPSISAETINKKLKAADEAVVVELPEDAGLGDAPAPPQLDGAVDMDAPTTSDPMDTAIPSETVPTSDMDIDPRQSSETMDVDQSTAPALHPATTALYIRNLVRPVQPAQLRAHLSQISQLPNSNANDATVTVFHLDTLRTHALAQFSTIAGASRARSALHDRIWPDEPSRRPLWVDFIPDDKIAEWVDTEVASETSRRDAKRWEVVYNTTPDGAVTATFQEVSAGSTPNAARQPSITTAPPAAAATTTTIAGPGMPNAPLGPRSDKERAAVAPPRPRAPEPSAPQIESFNVLDERYKSTTAKPKLYFLPQPESLAEKRRAELDQQTSRDWATVRVSKLKGRDSQLVRFTFDNGDELVDGGVDLGDFGRGGGGDRGGRRRGGGGGFRGRR